MIGRINRLTTDDGGHLIGSQFNGSGDLDNLVPMNSQINRAGGKWYQMEQEWKTALDAGKQVNVEIEPVYSAISQRPVEFNVEYTIDGKNTVTTIVNQIGG